jgi:anti-sigma regulatory factor (Ser/Thr protein kinase)
VSNHLAALLTFDVLDGIAFAAARGRLLGREAVGDCRASELGPFVELLHLSACALLPSPEQLDWLSIDSLDALRTQAKRANEPWLNAAGTLGLFRMGDGHPEDDRPWHAFCVAAHKAALSAGFVREAAAHLVAAIGEARSNVVEHSQASSTGTIVFRASHRRFEFAIFDRGSGVLTTLKQNSNFTHLADHGTALRLALSEGVSSSGERGRGFGFRQLFKGLSDLNGYLRFRSGDHALILEGYSPMLARATTAQKPFMPGFLFSVSCSTSR